MCNLPALNLSFRNSLNNRTKEKGNNRKPIKSFNRYHSPDRLILNNRIIYQTIAVESTQAQVCIHRKSGADFIHAWAAYC
jgi:hypothetical protein